MKTIDKIKQDIVEFAIRKKPEFESASAYIYAHPELAFEEHKSQTVLCNLLEKHGFAVTKGIAGLPTSFEAVYDSGKPGKTVALMGEYDCLPEIDRKSVV